MQSAGRIILGGSYSITAPVEEQIMLFSSLVLTEQVCFHQLNFNMFFLLLETYFLWGKWLKSRSGCSIESCLVWCHISSGNALWYQEENSLCLCFFSSVGHSHKYGFTLAEDVSSLFNTGLLALFSSWTAVGFSVLYHQTIRNYEILKW